MTAMVFGKIASMLEEQKNTKKNTFSPLSPLPPHITLAVIHHMIIKNNSGVSSNDALIIFGCYESASEF